MEDVNVVVASLHSLELFHLSIFPKINIVSECLKSVVGRKLLNLNNFNFNYFFSVKIVILIIALYNVKNICEDFD